jgi:hypothetical protein
MELNQEQQEGASDGETGCHSTDASDCDSDVCYTP